MTYCLRGNKVKIWKEAGRWSSKGGRGGWRREGGGQEEEEGGYRCLEGCQDRGCATDVHPDRECAEWTHTHTRMQRFHQPSLIHWMDETTQAPFWRICMSSDLSLEVLGWMLVDLHQELQILYTYSKHCVYWSLVTLGYGEVLKHEQ